ncbi:hypothetical protein BH11PSE13_BH11PSE13_43540 [soil metagenome]
MTSTPNTSDATFLRLRQICLVTVDLERVVDDLCAVFDVKVCHRDPEVGQFGLHNALMPFGTSFIEVVAPTREGTTAGRYLQRRHGEGGYMVILDSDTLPRWRTHVAEIGVRIAAPLALGDYEGMQLHPRDTGGALLEINTTLGGADLQHGAYWPAGPHWRDAVSTKRVEGIAGAVLQGADPGGLAAQWGRILKRAVVKAADWQLDVDNATVRFTDATDGRGEGLAAVTVQARDADAIRRAAQARALPHDIDSVTVCGVRFELLSSLHRN